MRQLRNQYQYKIINDLTNGGVEKGKFLFVSRAESMRSFGINRIMGGGAIQ